MQNVSEIVLKLEQIGLKYGKESEPQKNILENVDLSLYKKEIVGLLGRSGSGKSTLLRIISGLIDPTSGTRSFKGTHYSESLSDISMIFQSFALFPWLTLQQNVELGLEAKSLSKQEMTAIALNMLNIIGLSGYESAYPREISGGMRQRVGFARALAVNPTLLLMDEPFSALDVLTAQMLKTDFTDLWFEGKTSLESVLLVTHNIEEAILLCDRVLLFSSNPGRVISEIKITLTHPRDRLDPVFKELVEEIYILMTSELKENSDKSCNTPSKAVQTSDKLPKCSVRKSMLLLNELSQMPVSGKAALIEISQKFTHEINELLPIIDLLKQLKFIYIDKELICLSAAGKICVEANGEVQIQIIAEHLIQYMPIIGTLRRMLLQSASHSLLKADFMKELAKHFYEGDGEAIFDNIINWGRFAGLFYYNTTSHIISLENQVK